jgi:hypothetical protein
MRRIVTIVQGLRCVQEYSLLLVSFCILFLLSYLIQ